MNRLYLYRYAGSSVALRGGGFVSPIQFFNWISPASTGAVFIRGRDVCHDQMFSFFRHF